MVHPDHNIRPFARYNELYEKRGLGIDPAERAAKRFSKRDILDLQCWSNLVWMHPLAFELDKELAAFRAKGQHWTETEKLWLLDKQMELLREVIPLHRKLADRGQVELSTTPFYHPILPLLWDKRTARQAMPEVALPRHLEGAPESAVRQIADAVAYHEKVFGHKPRGMWPSEGSVAQALVGPIAAAGLEWIATDEEILSHSTSGWVSRDGQGFLRNPEMLYRPWRVEDKTKQLQIVFRDHAMSDQFGFHYQRMEPGQAVDDFIGKLEAIGRATSANAPHRPTLVSHHSRRRELLGVLPQQRRGIPARHVSSRGRASENQAHANLRLSRTRIPPRTKWAICSPVAGSAITSASGSAIRNAIGPGI